MRWRRYCKEIIPGTLGECATGNLAPDQIEPTAGRGHSYPAARLVVWQLFLHPTGEGTIGGVNGCHIDQAAVGTTGRFTAEGVQHPLTHGHTMQSQ